MRGFRAQQGSRRATEMLLTKAEQVSDEAVCAAGLRLRGSGQRGGRSPPRSAARPTAKRVIVIVAKDSCRNSSRDRSYHANAEASRGRRSA
jgi:hypothetical protein